MLFADLYRMKSPAQRVLLFPKTWATTGKGEYSDPYLDTSKRLLKMAARRYDVTLQPVDPIVEGADDSKPSSYPLALLFSLKQYKRLLYLQPSGFLLDSSPLDSLLTIPFESSLAALPADSTPAQSASALFIQPSAPHSSQFQDSSLTGAFSVADLLRILPAESLPVSAEEVDSLVRETSSLSQEAGDFNVTAFFSTAAYLQFSDPHLPGPEYDIPRMDFLRAKPSNVGARVAWESMYEKFRERRMDSCGLDLEPYRPPAIEEIKDSETPNEALENDTQTEL
ncbi:MAG: hypothetical protein M1819_004508 [Sarea resinae]|nr:MAG: hypothetical protein M1819_004508 [Sarea resinae]